MNKVLRQIKTVIIHKHYVFIGCCKLGIPWQGIIHDISKFTPIELSTSKYWTGKASPIPEEKARKGYSLGWTHHKNHNKHHWEYWTDFRQRTPICVPMPPKYLLEAFADWYGASRGYNKGKFDINIFKSFVIREFETKKMFFPKTKEIVESVIYKVNSEEEYFELVKKKIKGYKKWYKVEINGQRR